jgi:hypothetical protein
VVRRMAARNEVRRSATLNTSIYMRDRAKSGPRQSTTSRQGNSFKFGGESITAANGGGGGSSSSNNVSLLTQREVTVHCPTPTTTNTRGRGGKSQV